MDSSFNEIRFERHEENPMQIAPNSVVPTHSNENGIAAQMNAVINSKHLVSCVVSIILSMFVHLPTLFFRAFIRRSCNRKFVGCED